MLSKRWLVNGLLALVIGVSLLLGYRDRVQSGSEARNPITSLKPADVMSVTIQLGDKRIVLRRSADQWLIVSPLQWPAHNITLQRILGISVSEAETSIAATGIDLSALGLQDPKVILSLNDTRIFFGTTNNISDRRYLMTGTTIYLLADIHLPFISQGIAGLIDRRLLPPSIPLQTLTLTERKLSKDSTDNWQSDAPTDIPADRLNQFVNNWQTLEAPAVKIFNQAGMPLEKIVAGLDDDSEVEFLLMSIYPELVIARPDLGVEYHFHEKQQQELLSFTNPES
ncbi:MAG: DUF4340 domain-containing protein [Gammaproteobacteria bacterium]